MWGAPVPPEEEDPLQPPGLTPTLQERGGPDSVARPSSHCRQSMAPAGWEANIYLSACCLERN